MPLIRLISHPVNNSLHIDKLIHIEGLPESMMFTRKEGKLFLKTPWTIDITENIPKAIRDFHVKEPTKVTVRTPNTDNRLPPIDDEVEAYGFTLDYQNGPAELLWKQIERMIDIDTPRDKELPVPVVVSNDRRDGFIIGPEDIPVVILEDAKGSVLAAPAPVLKTKIEPAIFRCPVCNKAFDKPRAYEMHKRKTGHREPINVGA